MGSISSSLGSASGSSSGTAYFSGMSNYSQDLNNAIQREVEIASLPIELLQNDVNDLTNQSGELQTLDGDFSSVQSAVSGLASAAGNMLAASVSNGSVATATLGSGATAGSYTLQVTSLGSYSDSLSSDGLPTVTDPASQNVSASGSYTLTVGATSTPISYSGGNLNGLAQAINDGDAGVQATVVNVGSNSAPDYRLSLQSDALGPVSMQLNDGTQNLLPASDSTPGTLAGYSVNGHSVQSDSDTVTLAPGLTLHLTGTSAAATVTVAADPSATGNALQSLVSAYNTAITELGKNRGQSGGALAGQSIVYNLTGELQSLANYSTGAGGISSLSALGVTFDDTTGQLSFDQSVFDSATGSGQAAALAQFLGSATGGGFLQAATNTMAGMVDPTTGVLTAEINSIQANITSTNLQIAGKQNQVTQLQTNLTQQMAAADAMIYELQQQATEIQDMFTAIQDAQIGSANGA
jgi:flagellar hook-associated protein 2